MCERNIKHRKYDYVTTNPTLTTGHLQFAQSLRQAAYFTCIPAVQWNSLVKVQGCTDVGGRFRIQVRIISFKTSGLSTTLKFLKNLFKIYICKAKTFYWLH